MSTTFGQSPQETSGRPEPEPYTESEEMQATTAWAEVVSRVRCRFRGAHRSQRVERQARRAFILGYVVGVRNGHTGPALTGREVPISDAVRAVGALAEPDLPGVGQFVEYHGTQVNAWGRYWVQEITESADPRTGERDIRLTLYKGRRLILSLVRPSSVTAQPGAWWEPGGEDQAQAAA
ncbi:hypothetical protein [Streptacidiphilus neutrinimicus]|uniref:hypothetical protein n=1 Tax=Streptacidiphilus neutrinimicus TaxID=105420 RepID=UPI0005A8DECC|nr:hypothetical protein [Streptacidiphilus neutrinimicus]